MRVLVQRVRHAHVTVAGEVVGRIGAGYLLLAGIGLRDGEDEIEWMAEKVAGLRIFADEAGKMNRSIVEAGGAALVVSQFTLYGDCRHGKRPSFVEAAPATVAERWVERFCERLRSQGVREVAEGRFGARMDVDLVNDGPVTIWLERDAPALAPAEDAPGAAR